MCKSYRIIQLPSGRYSLHRSFTRRGACAETRKFSKRTQQHRKIVFMDAYWDEAKSKAFVYAARKNEFRRNWKKFLGQVLQKWLPVFVLFAELGKMTEKNQEIT